MRERFWERHALAELSTEEWEALCDGCGRCCLHKLEYEDTGEIDYTRVACKLLDLSTAQCSDYPGRRRHVPDCVQLTPATLDAINWLPGTCAYRRLNEGRGLPRWHPLLTGDAASVQRAGISVIGRVLPETVVDEDELDEHVIRWIRKH
ncbi:MAG: YcgN family cysteine cluster protein [Moraxellaceae bacterium]|nr:YcgN family cysteine cluster protein [Moraxellaceae bacterium]